jgi:hypothetical protein
MKTATKMINKNAHNNVGWGRRSNLLLLDTVDANERKMSFYQKIDLKMKIQFVSIFECVFWRREGS